jgi:hypothetical protein
VRTVPVLLTYDIHTHAAHSAPDVDRYLQHVLALHARMGVKASFFFPAEAARAMKQTVASLVRDGHGVGCHGLTHRNEYYKSMPASEQNEKLSRATREIEDIIQQRVAFFRAPVFKISGATIRVLEELGYEADLSMNSQRLGVLSSDVWNVSWMAASRGPYHPDFRRPWRRGEARLWEIPLSCLLLPFMVNTGQALGVGLMKVFFRALYFEARRTHRPIVYMAHPEDMYPWRKTPERPVFRWTDLLPSSSHGFRVRSALCETDPVKVAHLSETLLEYMCRFPGVRFSTVPEYVGELKKAVAGHVAAVKVAPEGTD